MTIGPALMWLAAALAAASTAYSLAVVAAAWAFGRERLRRRPGLGADPPAVSMLKPLRGAGGGLYENLASHARQVYPRFELLLAAEEGDDPALALADRLRREFPEVEIRTVAAGKSARGNPKTAILEQLAAEARGALFVVSDADVRVESDYLNGLVAELSDDSVALVTCLYRSEPTGGWASWIDALWISAEFPGQVLAARKLQGLRFALGATAAFRRSDLERIGGFAVLQPYLADDYQLGERLTAGGRRAVLAPFAVEIVPGDTTLRQVWRRHVRWSRTVGASRPWGRLGLIVTFGGAWALLAAAGDCLSQDTRSIGLMVAAVAVIARIAAGGAVAGWGVGSPRIASRPYLMPLVDLWSCAVWVAGLFRRPVWWQDRLINLDAEGRID